MTHLPLNNIFDAAHSFTSYHFHMEYVPGIFYDGEFNLNESRQYFQIGFVRDGIPVAEVFWKGSEGYGRQINKDNWIHLRGEPFPDLYQLSLQLLQGEVPVDIREEESAWFVEIHPDHIPPRGDTENFIRHVFGEPRDVKSRAFMERIAGLMQELDVRATMVISKQHYGVDHIETESQAKEIHSKFRLTFSLPLREVPHLPAHIDQSIIPGLTLPPEGLLLHLPTLGGWNSHTHEPWAQRSLNLIAELDQEQKYLEIYRLEPKCPKCFSQSKFPTNPPYPANNELQHHPIVLGADLEDQSGGMPNFYDKWFVNDLQYQQNPDYYYSHKPYSRYYHHYGGDGEGLEYQSFMYVASPPPCTCKNSAGNDSFYSARDWGYGLGRINEDLNRMTFTRAIEQYQRYTWEAKRNAYLMLGHVIHLLQDQGQPDHAKLESHGGSGFNQEEADDKFHFCEINAANYAVIAGAACGIFFWLCGPAAYALAYGVCRATRHSNEVGFERLIEDYWRLDRVIDRVNKMQVDDLVKNTGILHQPDYDSYFHAMSQNAVSAVVETHQKFPGANLFSPLGCEDLLYTIGVVGPGLDPNIDAEDPAQTQPFFELADKLAPQTIGLSAGLIQHFFDIVNYPPYVERVTVVQWEPNATPTKFARFIGDHLECVRYDAEWIAAPQGRNLVVHINEYLSTDRPVYIFILVGPASIGPTLGRTMSSVQLKVSGNYPGTGKPIDTLVDLNIANDDEVGTYYWGCFYPHNCSNENYSVLLEISGKDIGPHYTGRQPAGNELDAHPETYARVDIQSPTYEWKNYTPGTDLNHRIKIARYEWRLETTKLPLTIDRSEMQSGEVELKILQKALDCQREPFWGPPTCSVKWKLVDQVTWYGTLPRISIDHGHVQVHDVPVVQVGTPEDFHLQVDFIQSGIARLIITPGPGFCFPGTCIFEVQYATGEPPKNYSVKVIVEVV